MQFKKIKTTLAQKHIILVGIGALGSEAAKLLIQTGIGRLTLIDRDCVEARNIADSPIYTKEDIGETKATAALNHLKSLNPSMQITAHVADLTAENSSLLMSDLILDGTDNLQTRFLINEFSHKYKIPWVYAAGLRDEGYVHAYIPGTGSCFACVFGEAYGLESCETSGILSETVSRVATIQVREALKIFSEKKPEQDLIFLYGKDNFFSLPLKKNCIVCQQKKYPYLSGEKKMPLVRLCGTGTYQLRIKNLDLVRLEKKLRKLGDVKLFSSGIHFQSLTVFSDGRVLIHAKTLSEARKIFTRCVGA